MTSHGIFTGAQQQLQDRMARIGRIEKMTASASGSVSPGPNE
jgi:hypothetical protein